MRIPFQGGNFTWSNNRDSSLWSRIDGFLFFPIGMITSRTWFRVDKVDYLEFSHITFLFFLIVVIFRGAKVILNLKTCS
jgi:hypothetical protein